MEELKLCLSQAGVGCSNESLRKPPALTKQIYSSCKAVAATQKHKVILQPAEWERIPHPGT